MSTKANAPGQGGENARLLHQNNYTKNAAGPLDHGVQLQVHGSEPRVDSRLIAEQLGLQHKNVIAQIRSYLDDFKQLGPVAFQTRVVKRPQGGGVPTEYAMLNEDQAYLLLTFSRNTVKIRQLKVRLVQAFREARQAQDIHQAEYLPAYHHLHDEISRLADGSEKQRFVHINVNRVINKAVGVRSGERHTLPLPSKSLLIVAQSVALQAMSGAQDHREGYKAAKTALQGFRRALEGEHHA